ncbi:hypothetical protein [Paenibacillus tuaregi]|uniref:hypothetical protein n=1 Tax=Paenibacillus tuaregi TaxID=1816681 RepID=UPI000839737D|nr:hypothetical protein [Paenibacillus tuaregi]
MLKNHLKLLWMLGMILLILLGVSAPSTVASAAHDHSHHGSSTDTSSGASTLSTQGQMNPETAGADNGRLETYKSHPDQAEAYPAEVSTGIYIFSVFFTLGITLFVIARIGRYGNALPQMSGMMAAMAIAMMAGLVVGTVAGVMLETMFASTWVGVAFGLLTGYAAGRRLSMLAVLDGMLSGIMGGMMGAMLGVMVIQDHPVLTVLFMDVLLILIVMALSSLWKFRPSCCTEPDNTEEELGITTG